MKKSYRIALETIYVNALVGVGIRGANPDAVTAHKDGSATVQGVGAAHQARISSITGIEVLNTGAASMTFRIPAAQAYHDANPPFYTAEEKAAMEAKKAERATRVSNVPLLDMDEDEGDQD